MAGVKLRTHPVVHGLEGELTSPGDKSISHRALILGSLASGETLIQGLLQAEDVKATATACRHLGAEIWQSQGLTHVRGIADVGMTAPVCALNMGNSGTAMRLLAGVLAAQPFESVLLGDASLSRRPMRRIVEPLTGMGARIETGAGGVPPLIIHGNPALKGIHYQLPVASAQVKSCLLLAGLYATGRTCVTEPGKSRDHTERMLPAFGVNIAEPCCVSGGNRLRGTRLAVPGDISSAAFFLAAAVMVPGSDLWLRNVGLNSTRDGMLRVLAAMGADIAITDRRLYGQEEVADIHIRHSHRVAGVDIPESWVPSLIDELPVIMALAAITPGLTRIRGAAELRVKESDRIAVMARGLETLGVHLEEHSDGIDIEGGEIGSGVVDGAGDHRCAMSFAVLGQVAKGAVVIDGCSHINTSYPEFTSHLRSLGGQVEVLQTPTGAGDAHAG